MSQFLAIISSYLACHAGFFLSLCFLASLLLAVFMYICLCMSHSMQMRAVEVNTYSVVVMSQEMWLLSHVILQMLSVTCEEFAIALDKQFGAKLWSECPDLANKGNNLSVFVCT